MNIEGGFPETLASGFSIEAGMALRFDAAAAKDGLRAEAASVGSAAFDFGFELRSPPGEDSEAGEVSSGVAVSFAVFGTT